MPAASAALRASSSCQLSFFMTTDHSEWRALEQNLSPCLPGGATDKKKLTIYKSPGKMIEHDKVTRVFVLLVIWRRVFLWAYLLRVSQSCFSSRQHVNQRLDRLLHNSLLHFGFSLKILEDTQATLRETRDTSIIISQTGYSPTSAHYSRHSVKPQCNYLETRNIKKCLHRQKFNF